MPRATEVRQVTFAGGEIAPTLHARTDLAKYYNSLRRCENFLVTQHGVLMNRSGTRLVAEVRDSARRVRLVPFVFNNDQTFVLEFGAGYIRFFRNGAQVLKAGVPMEVITPYEMAHAWDAGTTYGKGSIVGYGGLVWQAMDDVALGAGPPAGVWKDVTAWSGDLNLYKFAQIGDVITIVHPLYAPRELKRYANDDWRMTTIAITRPASPTNLGFRFTVSAVRGVNPANNIADYIDTYPYQGGDTCRSTTVGAPGGPLHTFRSLQDNNVGKHPHVEDNNLGVWWMDEGEGLPTLNHLTTPGRPAKDWRWVVTSVNDRGIESLPCAELNPNMDTDNPSNSDKICLATDREVRLGWTAVPGTKYYKIYRGRNGLYGYVGESITVDFTDDAQAPDYTHTPPTAKEPFALPGDYPSVIAYFQQRRWYGCSINNSQTIWGSKVGDFYNFDTGLIPTADDSVEFTLSSRQLEIITNLLGLRALLMLTTSTEWSVSGGQAGPITPSNVEMQPHGSRGSTRLEPIPVGNVALFVQAMGNVVRELVYDYASDSFSGNDLTVLAQHLFQNHKIIDWAYAAMPYSILWAVREDGVLLGCTYLREQEVVAWHRHSTPGDQFENVCAVPEGSEHGVYVVVKRGAKRYVERFTTRQAIPRLADGTIDASRGVFLDASLTYEGAPATTFSGLGHLEGRAVMALADGYVIGPYTVTGGAIDISEAMPDGAALVHVGLGYACTAETLDLAAPRADMRSTAKTVFRANVEVIDSRGFKVGVSDNTREWRQRKVADNWDPVAPFNGFVQVSIPSAYSYDARLALTQDLPLPVTILGITREADVN